ncbi:hypothetical protein [Streptomyces althioticus]|uniref:hypothetical protein n=1 Tax=Streptomyces althioticus TaxID=83380 RepID=UPI00081AFCB1|nr:hypothetical protein GA0115238_14006 [Streptomyces sp. di50b]SCE43569.1 hypothetical protein GA0115245_136825 [Streptomyces sp. di188]
MTADRWTRMVRQQVGMGRLLPLGGPYDGAWIAERAASGVLRGAAEREVPEVRLNGVRIGLADPGAPPGPAVPAPPSALPPGPLRLTAEFAAAAARPLPETASRLRTSLAVTATERLGLDLTEVDLRVTELLDEQPTAAPPGAGLPTRAPEPTRAPYTTRAEPSGAPHPTGADLIGAPDPTGAAATPDGPGTPGDAVGPGRAAAPTETGTPGAADSSTAATDTPGDGGTPEDWGTPAAAGGPSGASTAEAADTSAGTETSGVGQMARTVGGAVGESGVAGAPGAAQGAGGGTPHAFPAMDDAGGDGSEDERVGAVVSGVAGVARLTGSWGRPVRIGERAPGAGAALPRRHVRVDLAVAAGFRPLEVARAVRAAVTEALADRPTVAVLVTDLD